jgi:hypothetical protein
MYQGSLSAITAQNQKFIDRLLDGKSEAFKAKVLEFVTKSGLSTQDPEFVVLLAISILTGVLTEKPTQMNEMFVRWQQGIQQSLELTEIKIFEQQKTAVNVAISQTARELVRKAERQEANRFWKSIAPGVIVTGIVLAVGFVAGMAVPTYLSGGYVEGRKLTAQDAATLDWANSADGQLARNLVDWNRDYLKVCERDIKKLGVRFSLGNQKSSSGFCLLWVTPPQQRKFE